MWYRLFGQPRDSRGSYIHLIRPKGMSIGSILHETVPHRPYSFAVFLRAMVSRLKHWAIASSRTYKELNNIYSLGFAYCSLY